MIKIKRDPAKNDNEEEEEEEIRRQPPHKPINTTQSREDGMRKQGVRVVLGQLVTEKSQTKKKEKNVEQKQREHRFYSPLSELEVHSSTEANGWCY